MEKMRNYTEFLPGRLKESSEVEQTDVDVKKLNWVLERKKCVKAEVGLNGFRNNSMTGVCKQVT
jgi:hypothetical protein